MLDKLKHHLWNLFSSGLPKEYDIDVLRKLFLVNLLIIFGVFFLGLLGIIAFLQQNYALGIVDYTVFIFLIWLFVFIRKTKKYQLSVLIGTLVTGCFYFYLIASGGVNNTAFVWAFTFPLIALFLLGTRLGGILSLALLAIAGIVFLFGGNVSFFTKYDANLIIRFIPAYLAVLMFALVMEKIRGIVQNQLRTSNTGLVKAIGELKSANDLKTQLLYIAAHDLKNPLNTIKSGADYLLQEDIAADDRIELLKMISNSTNSMLSIISDLLDSAEIEASEFTLKWEETDINFILCGIIDGVEFSAKQKNQKIIFECPEKIKVVGDSSKLKIAFQNVIDNAIKYSPTGTSINISVKNLHPNLLVQVKDEGEGFSEEDKKKVFGKFQRLSARPTAGESSTGLGLSIVKSIIDLHNGSIWIESEKGKGTTFNILLKKE
ncbi:MAG: HAMP domain-containing sensor histidine kinase [bacterium]